jgi:hypothetical protein
MSSPLEGQPSDAQPGSHYPVCTKSYARSRLVPRWKRSPTPAATATEPSAETPRDAAAAQQALEPLQWVSPALTGALIVLAAHRSEQQRTASPLRGALDEGLLAVKGAMLKSTALRRAA